MDANPASADMYERLGVAPDATPEQVTAAFKQMRKELHPDSRPESLRGHFNGLMQNVNEANQTLSDPRSRAKYDARRRAATQAAQGQQRRDAQEERRQREEAQRRADQQRREAEARDRQRREEAERRAREEAQGTDDEEWFWSEEGDDPGPAGDHEAPRAEPEPAGTSGGGLVHRLPGPVHRAGLYVSGSWAWFLAVWGVGLVPIPGLGTAAVLVGLGASVLAGILWLKAGAVMTIGERVLGRFFPGLGRFSAIWYGRRVLEAVALAPVVFFLGALFSFVWMFASLAAMVYVGLWVAEILRRPRSAAETGG